MRVDPGLGLAQHSLLKGVGGRPTPDRRSGVAAPPRLNRVRTKRPGP